MRTRKLNLDQQTNREVTYSQSMLGAAMTNVHLTQCSLPLFETTERFLFLVPQQPDELFLVASAETFIELQPVQQLAVLVVELSASFTRQHCMADHGH